MDNSVPSSGVGIGLVPTNAITTPFPATFNSKLNSPKTSKPSCTFQIHKDSMKFKRFLSIPIFSVFLLVGFVYYVTVFIFIDDWLSLQSSAGSLNALIFTVLAFLSVFSFLVCVLTDPGGVPSGYVPDIEDSEVSDQEHNKSVRLHGLSLIMWSLNLLPILVSFDKKCRDNELLVEEHDMRSVLRFQKVMGPDFSCSINFGTFGVLIWLIVECELLFLDDDFQGIHMRRCDKCSSYKPPRAHHCRVCRTCVLRMDHHCLWINNCVGHRNYKTFFILVLYATMASIYSSPMECLGYNFKLRPSEGLGFQQEGSPQGLLCELQYILRTIFGQIILQITCGVMILGLSLTLGTLFSWHIYLITVNMTTIEYYEGKRAAWLARKSGQSYHHPFNVGAYKNITLILGPNMLKWVCPTAVSHLKDGIDFPAARDSS
ncbi:unnamed protein product [Ilex paraguariensis]|uniref:S-acyltransferase n=1 Tax=Ilex paraguariensis TaxID=185542 RepID=A0ABC8S8J9_9AQUA